MMNWLSIYLVKMSKFTNIFAEGKENDTQPILEWYRQHMNELESLIQTS